ncbi:uncharacterized protein BXZ73DRAFT_82724 [Epithele typhae]|uniref:uncharacterized protein n=1 Tax=Epithele typhae TaxID=378194 RepID=UPI002007B68B|nr:uncharacterized protein BXZ73DRAFT_82724 [Epithele typhae]KAH9911544.1 hypothetical protein BXZ73DRAFT_82724 [Epithele typhae]
MALIHSHATSATLMHSPSDEASLSRPHLFGGPTQVTVPHFSYAACCTKRFSRPNLSLCLDCQRTSSNKRSITKRLQRELEASCRFIKYRQVFNRKYDACTFAWVKWVLANYMRPKLQTEREHISGKGAVYRQPALHERTTCGCCRGLPSSFQPLSRFTISALDHALADIDAVIATGRTSCREELGQERPRMPHVAPNISDSSLSSMAFDSIWARNVPLVVNGILDKLQGSWTPDYFIRHFGREEDWPDGERFRDKFPELCNSFALGIPDSAQDVAALNGVLNLASFYPLNSNIPDLGPKMYIAAGIPIAVHGTTKLHLDVTDTINLMVWSSNLSERGAIWHLFPPDTLPLVRRFLKEQGCTAEEYGDPIHSHRAYVTEEMLIALEKQHGVFPVRIEQRAGDAVFIPAGWAHQALRAFPRGSSTLFTAVPLDGLAQVPARLHNDSEAFGDGRFEIALERSSQHRERACTSSNGTACWGSVDGRALKALPPGKAHQGTLRPPSLAKKKALAREAGVAWSPVYTAQFLANHPATSARRTGELAELLNGIAAKMRLAEEKLLAKMAQHGDGGGNVSDACVLVQMALCELEVAQQLGEVRRAQEATAAAGAGGPPIQQHSPDGGRLD